MPRKKYKETKSSDTKSNRIRPILNDLYGNEDADDLMLSILGVLKESGKVPSVGKYYVFVYNPKTSGIQYDQNPLVGVTDVFKWGFRAINFHWGESRQYTWNEVAGQLYEVYANELRDLQQIPFGKFRINN